MPHKPNVLPWRLGTNLKTASIAMALLIVLIGVGLTINENKETYRGVIDNSQPSTYANGCHLPLNEFEPGQCYINQNSQGPLVYLYGDSHAAQWVPALQTVSKSLNFKLRILTKSSCPYVNININENCRRWQENVYREVSKNRPSLIILASLTNGKYFTPLNDIYYLKLWNQNFYKTLALFKNKTQILLIEDTPYSPFDTSKCLLDKSSIECNFKFNESRLTKSIRKFSRLNNIDYLSVNINLCNNEICRSSNNRFNYYTDNHHISVSLSEKLSKPFSEYLKQKFEASK
jgi:hypothetical protein